MVQKYADELLDMTTGVGIFFYFINFK